MISNLRFERVIKYVNCRLNLFSVIERCRVHSLKTSQETFGFEP